MATVKIRDYPNAALLANSGIEITQGDFATAASRIAPARLVEVIARSIVFSRSTENPPGDPAEGDRYYVPVGATGAWAGRNGQIAEWLLVPNDEGPSAGSWYFDVALGVNFVADEKILVSFTIDGGQIVTNNFGGYRTISSTDDDTSIKASDNGKTIRVNAIASFNILFDPTDPALDGIRVTFFKNDGTLNEVSIVDNNDDAVFVLTANPSTATAQVFGDTQELVQLA